jgi:hypothetical protein
MELRALYAEFERASTREARQAIWDAIVAHRRSHEVRVGSEAETARDAVLEEHHRRRLWPF